MNMITTNFTVTEFVFLGLSSQRKMQLFLFIMFLFFYLLTMVGNIIIITIIIISMIIIGVINVPRGTVIRPPSYLIEK